MIIGDRNLLTARAKLLGQDVSRLTIHHIPLRAPVLAGHCAAANAPYVLATLDAAIQGCQRGEFAAMVTAPVHKGVINDAGIPFSGHTEYLAEHTNTPRVVMMLTGAGLRVALATTHLPLKEVSAAITRDDFAT